MVCFLSLIKKVKINFVLKNVISVTFLMFIKLVGRLTVVPNRNSKMYYTSITFLTSNLLKYIFWFSL